MKSKIQVLTIFLFILIMISCSIKRSLTKPETVILPLGDTIRLTGGSLVYSLPMTVFTVQIEMERTIEKPGPYSRYAGELLGIKDAITQETENWSIKNIELNTLEELDPSEFYVIESNTLIQTNALALKKAGLILDINPDIYRKVDGKIFSKESAIDQMRFLDLGADEYYTIRRDTAFRIVKMDTTFIKIPYLVEKRKQLTIDQLAEKAAKTLMELRDGRHLILTGEANVFPQNEAAINEINRLEEEYTALFAGKIWKESKNFSYTLIPTKEMGGKQVVLFRFSELTGPEDAVGKGGKPVNVELIPAHKAKELTIIKKPQPEGLPVQKFDKLYYRVPDVADIKITLGNETLYNARKLIYQFGEVIPLPANFIIGK